MFYRKLARQPQTEKVKSDRTIIRLSEKEQNEVIVLGKKLFKNKIDKGTNKDPVDKFRSGEWLDIIGIGGEYVVAKYLEIDYNFELYEVRDYCDLQVGLRLIEVKVNKFGDDLLKIPRWQIKKNLDFYVLVKLLYKLETWEIIGWIEKEEFMKIMELTTFAGYENVPMFTVNRVHLQKMIWLRRLLKDEILALKEDLHS